MNLTFAISSKSSKRFLSVFRSLWLKITVVVSICRDSSAEPLNIFRKDYVKHISIFDVRVGVLEKMKCDLFVHFFSFDSLPMIHPIATRRVRLAFHSKLS